MKKKIVGVLALCMCMFSMASCDVLNNIMGNNSSSSQEVVVDLNAAKNFLLQRVPPFEEGRVDYEVDNEIALNVVYTIEWSVTAKDGGAAVGVTLEKGDKTTKVNVDEGAAEEVDYVLVATISANGQSITVNIPRTLEAAPSKVPAAIVSKPEENTAYKFGMYQANLGKDYYFTGEMNGYYGKTSTEADKAVDLYVEYAANSNENFYIYFTDAAEEKQYISVTKSGTHINFGFGAEALTQFVFNTELGSFTTVEEFEKDGVSEVCYLGTYGTFYTVGPSQISKAETSFVGKLVGLVDRNLVSAEDKLNATAKELNLAAAYANPTLMDLPSQGTMFPDVSISWTVDGPVGTVGLLYNRLTLPTSEVTNEIKLTATISVGGKTQTKEFTFKSVPHQLPAAILEAAAGLGANEKFGNNVTLTGMITSVDTAYSEEHANITVTMKVGDASVQCYRLAGTGADKLAAGYEITVTGILKNYNGTIEFDTGCTLDSYKEGTLPEEPPVEEETKDPAADSTLTIKQALELGASKEHNTYTEGKYYVEGVITEVYNTQYGNMKIKDADGNILTVYGTYSADGKTSYDKLEVKPVAGDTVKVYGIIGQYNGTPQVKNGWIVAHTPATPDEGETDEPVVEEKLPEVGTAYYLNGVNAKGALYFIGTVTKGRIDGTADSTKAVKVFFEATETAGEYYLYFMNGETKTYILGSTDAEKASTADFSFVTEKPADTWVVNTATKAIQSKKTSRFIGTQVASTYNNFSTYAASNIGTAEYATVWFAKEIEGTDTPVTPPVEEETKDPAADSTLTIKQALELGASKEHNTYTEGKYYVEGVITEVYNTQYGNMKIKDADGNILTVYGTYSADGKTSYDKLEVKPVAGDTVKVYGIIGQYNGTPQVKNGWIVAHTPATPDEDETEEPVKPTEPTTLTIADAVKQATALEHNTVTDVKYYVTGTVKSIANTTYGNMTIEDADGNSIYVYGTYSADGSTRYDAMDVKPAVGDTVKLLTVLSNYNGPQLKNAWVIELTPAKTEEGGEVTPPTGGEGEVVTPPANDEENSEVTTPAEGEESGDKVVTENGEVVAPETDGTTNA